MASRPLSLARLWLLGTAAVLIGTLMSCSREPVAAPRSAPDAAVFAGKPAGSPAVTATSPAYGDRGTTVDVHIMGSGFTTGAQATWLLRGAADAAHVRTNSTTFVSSTELVANITIASDAELAFWDVQVALLGGKNGVGTEAHEITSAQILGAGNIDGSAQVRDMNDQVQVVGWGATHAWVYDDQLGMVDLGSGAAHGIDPLGAVVLGANGSSISTAWVRAGNSWLAELLPRPSGSVGGMAHAATRVADGTLLVIGWDDVAGARKGLTNQRPVAWRRSSDGLWSAPSFYPIPSGFTTASARDVNPLEQVVGQLGAEGGIVWDSPTSYTLLDGIPNRINASGTLIVGGRNGGAVYWWRDPVTHAWHTPGVSLPTLAGAGCVNGLARGVNDAGIIVGWTCTNSSSGEDKPTVWRLDFSGAVPVLASAPIPLPGLGIKSRSVMSSAATVTESAPYIVAGSVAASSTVTFAVRWILP